MEFFWSNGIVLDTSYSGRDGELHKRWKGDLWFKFVKSDFEG